MKPNARVIPGVDNIADKASNKSNGSLMFKS